MEDLQLPNHEAARIAVMQEISQSEEARFHHRLHALLLFINGQSCHQIADLFGEDRRTVQRWINRFEKEGVEGLRDSKRPGRPALLTDFQMKRLERELSRKPAAVGDHRPFRWDGKMLAEHLRLKYGVSMGVRQCQRLIQQQRKFRSG